MKSDERTTRALDAYRAQPNERVYYVRVGKLIKIGFTSQLKARLAAYPPDSVLLATEPGGANLERRRHEQFGQHLRHGNEWFAPGRDLIEHINRLRKQQKMPPLPVAA